LKLVIISIPPTASGFCAGCFVIKTLVAVQKAAQRAAGDMDSPKIHRMADFRHRTSTMRQLIQANRPRRFAHPLCAGIKTKIHLESKLSDFFCSVSHLLFYFLFFWHHFSISSLTCVLLNLPIHFLTLKYLSFFTDEAQSQLMFEYFCLLVVRYKQVYFQGLSMHQCRLD